MVLNTECLVCGESWDTDYDPEACTCTHQHDQYVVTVLQPSQEWADQFGHTILDPDGWDRKNFTESWNELITETEYMDRYSRSTVQIQPSSS